MTEAPIGQLTFRVRLGTAAFGISAAGVVVGNYFDSAGKTLGFILKGNHFTPVQYPGAAVTSVSAINSRGDVVGFYGDLDTFVFHGFLLSNGVYTNLEYPGNLLAQPTGINDSGLIVGYYDDSQTTHGFTATVQGRSSCSFTLGQQNITVPATGGSYFVALNTSADCLWAMAPSADWITSNYGFLGSTTIN